MEPRLSLVTLGVSDVARARAFYEALGFRASSASQAEVAFFQAGALALAVWDRAALAGDAKVSALGSGFAGIAIAHNVREKHQVEAVLAEAERAGGPDHASGRGRLLGRSDGVFFRSGRASLGGRLEPAFRDRGGRRSQASRLGIGE